MTLRKSVLTAGPVFAVGVVLLGGFVATAADGPGSPRTAVRGLSDPPRLSAADRLVRQALAAELAGDNARRDKLLSEALKEDPNCRSARWQSGYVSLEGKWQTPEDAQQRFSVDRNLTEYRKRRAAAEAAGAFARQTVLATWGNSNRDLTGYRRAVVETERTAALSPAAIQAHADLARWCRSKQLSDEERAHWTQVLLELHDNKEAELRLGLHWFRGGLYTNAQMDAVKKQAATENQQRADWKPTVLRWRDALDDGAAADRAAAVAEMAEFKDPSIIPALEAACISDLAKAPANREAASPFQKEAISLLGRMLEQRATYSLTGDSVFATEADLRRLATEELKKRPLHDFVPILLSGLANPIRFEYFVSFNPAIGSFACDASATQDARDAVKHLEYSRSASNLFPTTVVVVGLAQARVSHRPVTVLKSKTRSPDLGDIPSLVYGLQDTAASFGARNRQTERTNERINQVLEFVTKNHAQLPSPNDDSDVITDQSTIGAANSTANYWWNWWDRYNESYRPYPKPFEAARYSSTSLIYDPPQMTMSCFPAGTPVATQTGPIAIDRVQIGDRVLAQDADSGELSLKPVLGTTVRPPVEMVLITTTRGDLRTTRGHPFWIVGKGWRMAKELEVGDRVVSLGGSATVTALDTLPPEPAYNLIVADFGTYFVGGGRILVHDNTPRLPTPAAIPGYVADAR